jgi:hypothetical protein
VNNVALDPGSLLHDSYFMLQEDPSLSYIYGEDLLGSESLNSVHAELPLAVVQYPTLAQAICGAAARQWPGASLRLVNVLL